MKKLLLLFTTLLFISCSSEDSDENEKSTQTFLEKYDGVYWKRDYSDGGDDWIQFNINDWVECEDYGSEPCNCENPITWGKVYEDFYAWNIKENGVEKLVISVSSDYDGTILSYDVTVTIINYGNGIEIKIPEADDFDLETYTRFNSQPCN